MSESGTVAQWTRPENAVLLLFAATLAWMPFPYGSNRPWAELLLAVALGSLLLAWSGLVMSGLAVQTPLVRRLKWPAICAGVALLWALLQSVDLAWLQQVTGLPLTGIAHAVWGLSADALGKPAGAYVSVDPEGTRQALVAALVSLSAFLLAFNLGRDRDRAAFIAGSLIVISSAYALLAIVMLELKVDLQAWVMPEARSDFGRLAGPFMNPNHFAAFISLGAIAALGVFAERVRQSVIWDRGSRVMARSVVQSLTGPNALLLAAVVLLLSALLLTQSRAAVASFVVGVLALSIMLSRGRDLSVAEASGRRAIVALLVAVLGLSIALSADPLLNRVGAYGLNDTTRTSIAMSAIKAVQSAPLQGHGFGGFEHYYPFFSDGTVAGTVDEAHNDVLETLSDLGVPAGLAYMAAPVMIAFMCFGGAARRRRDRVYPAVAVAASVCAGLHALADFSLQVPAVAVSYAVLLGIGAAQSWRTNMDMVR